MIRTPIYINPHAIVLLTIYEKETDDIEDVWAWCAENGMDTAEHAAKQFVDQLCEGGNCSASLLMAIRKELLRELLRNDVEFGSTHANTSITEDAAVAGEEQVRSEQSERATSNLPSPEAKP